MRPALVHKVGSVAVRSVSVRQVGSAGWVTVVCACVRAHETRLEFVALGSASPGSL